MYGDLKNSFLKIRNLKKMKFFRASVTIQIIDFKKIGKHLAIWMH